MSLDERIFRLLCSRSGPLPLLDAPACLVSRFGATGEVALMLLACIGGGRAGRRATARCLVAVAALYPLIEFLGWRVGRPRPFTPQSTAQPMLRHEPGRSFPSRHVASAVAMAIIVRPASGRLGNSMGFLAALLGLSRVRAGLHYPTDVLAGTALGYAFGRALR